MKWEDLAKEKCSVARSVAVLGDRWTLMIIRDCFRGVRRFEDFQKRLAISRTIIADRLGALVDEGILARTAYQDRPARYEYRLTNKGLSLHPVLMAIVHWGDEHYSGKGGPPLLHRHRACGHTFSPVTTCSECGEAVGARDVEVIAGSKTAELFPEPEARLRRRASK
jgi:DNA-binding HxlR family transcriptional regulator